MMNRRGATTTFAGFIVPALLPLVVACETPAARPPVAQSPPAPVPAPADTAAPTASTAAAPSAAQPPSASSGPPSTADVLKTALTAEGYRTSIMSGGHGSFVVLVSFNAPAPRAETPALQLGRWLDAHGDALGYGALGTRRPDTAAPPQDRATRITIRFPAAARCPNLRVDAAFDAVGASSFAPKVFHVACAEGDAADATIANTSALYERIASAPAADPLATWLRAEGLAEHGLTRDAGGVKAAVVGAPVPSSTARLAYVKALAERAAQAEGLPALDTVDLTPPKSGPTDPALLPGRFVRLELRLARPPLDGPCIDPRVTVDVTEKEEPAGVVQSFTPSAVEVRCEKEPPARRAPPADAARPLPKAASGTAPFVAVCEYVSWTAGFRHYGLAIDKRGDVYEFSGGKVFSGSSAHELAVLVRHGKAYVATLSPADVDRLVALTPAVEREPLVEAHDNVFDAPGGGCSLLRAGPAADSLVQVRFDAVGRERAARSGSASKSARAVLQQAEKLAEGARAAAR